ncbi:hypothetical protein [Paraburkholderia bryophila]|uniref:Uncharacterized protein n=1 Tax=Paraburkholderia bryophila TaxID=420952 RepID=A0A329B7N8_9BURK|nr:hypothetical protein [Paraburkholderia bryophila]RAS17359.1 hypothetical protein BX591_14732 [Paraburkholderia bryophila]
MDAVSAHGNARAQIRAHDALAGFARILCLLRHILASLLALIFMLSIAMYDLDEQSAGMEVSRYVRRRSRLCKIPT